MVGVCSLYKLCNETCAFEPQLPLKPNTSPEFTFECFPSHTSQRKKKRVKNKKNLFRLANWHQGSYTTVKQSINYINHALVKKSLHRLTKTERGY